MVIDPRRKRFVMNMQLRQCFARAKPIRLKISQKNPDFSGFFYFQKKLKVLKKQNFQIWLQKAKLATLLHKN